MLEGIDISHHQASTPDLTGIDFVIVRATYGTTRDALYPMHVANARAAGKVVGAYHFARPTAFGSAAAQAEAFLSVAADADFWVIDREKDGDNGTITVTATKAFVAAMHATGRRIGLYTSQSNWKEVGQDFAWVARWSSEEPVIPWDIWQYDGGGADRLDNDRFRGTRGALLALGAPLEEWVASQVARAEEAESAHAEAVAQRDQARDSLAVVVLGLDAAKRDIENVATGLRLVRQFEEVHP